MKKKKIAILDTETTFFGQEVFDIGLLIGDKKGNIDFKQGWLVQENIDKKWFYEEKRELYMSRLTNPSYPLTLLKAKHIFQEMEQILDYFEISEIYAYNAIFDTRVIRNLSESLNLENPLSGKEHECLWFWAAQTIFQQKEFAKFCKRYPEIAMTEKGNYKTSAEIAYAYIYQQPQFVEEHTAVEDCMIEYEIFLACQKQKKMRCRGIAGNPWILVQTEEQIQKLPPQFRSMKINLEIQIEQATKFIQRKNLPLKIQIGL